MDKIKEKQKGINPKIAEQVFKLSLFVYVFVRFIIAIPFLTPWGVNPYIFFLLDVITAFPYTIGVPKIVRYYQSKDFPRIINWSIILVASFLIPYIYILYAGRNQISSGFMIGIVLMVILLGVKAFFSIRAQVLRTE